MRRVASFLVLMLILTETSSLIFAPCSVKIVVASDATTEQVFTLSGQDAVTEDSVIARSADWWTMYRHEPSHTGCSSSRAPDTNLTLWVHQFGDWVTTSPAVHGNRVFVGSDDTNVYSLNAADGFKIWSYSTGRAIASSPAVANGRVYVGSDNGKLYCLDEATGAFLWSYATAQSISSSPCVSDGRVIFGSDDYGLYCVNDTTGALLWRYSTGAGVTSSPAVAQDAVFFGSLDFKVYSLNLTNGHLLWSYDTRGSISASPTAVNGQVFVSSFNNMYCFQASNGGIIWNRTVGGPIHSSPAFADGDLFFGCDDSNMYCLNSNNGNPKWKFTVGGYIYSSPALADHKLYFGSNDQNVYCLNTSDGTLIWKYNTGGYIRTSSPAVAGKTVFIAASYLPVWSGKLFAFGRVNSAPVASNLTITPQSPTTSDDLVGSYIYHDEDGDPQTGTEIAWYKDDVLQPSCNGTFVIPANETLKGQTWLFAVRPCDGYDFGPLQISPPVTILNSIPTIDQYTPLSNPTIREGETQVFNITKADADLDPLNVTWSMNGSVILEQSDSFIYTSDFASSGNYNVTVAVSDGASRIEHEWLMVVLNVERDVAVTDIVLSKTVVGQGFMVEINVTLANQGDMTETLYFTVMVNSTAIRTGEVTLQNGTSTLDVTEWNTSNFTRGHYTVSASVSPVPWEQDISDNTLEGGQVIVTIPGDTNGDSTVDIFDVVSLTSVYNVRRGDSRYQPNRDLNDDGIIDLLDVVILTRHYNPTHP